VAGLYAHWRLLEAVAFPPGRIATFEAHHTPGGRLRSIVLPESGGLVVDAGAMAFPTAHRHVIGLMGHLGLPTRDHPIGSRRSLLHLRGRARPYRTIRRALTRPFRYAMSRSDQIAGSGGRRLLMKASDRLLPGSSAFTPEAWEEAARTAMHGGMPLRDWPLRAALMQVVTAEEVDFLEQTSGYSIFVRAANAATGLAWAFNDINAGRLVRPVEGTQSLALALSTRIHDRAGIIRCGHRLESATRVADGFRLAIRDGASGEMRTVSARQLVLALPKRAMEQVGGLAGLVGAETLDRVLPWPMCTLSLVYPSAWWARIGIERGRTVSDLPVRQIWQHGASPDGPGFLCSQSDAEDADYWRGLAPPSDRQGFAAIRPEDRIAREMHRQVLEIYGAHVPGTIPAPTGGYFQDWAAPDFGAAFHTWQKGVLPRQAAEAAIQPSAGLPLFICGEAWSRSHGWVEGALDQTEAMLRRHFGLAAPTWLN
jgi:monoamine oxidase